MTNIVVLGHGGYAEGIKKNLNMLLGELDHYYFLDFYPSEDLEDFKKKLNELLTINQLDQVLFVCDLTGGSPFREACLYAFDKENMEVVAGINTAAFSEIYYMLDTHPKHLAETVVEVTRESVMHFAKE